MKYVFALLFGTLIFNTQIEAQAKFRKLKVIDAPPAPWDYSKEVLAIEKKNHDCVRINPKSFAQRIKQYPFSETSEIKFVSFNSSRLPIENDTICYSKLLETKTLTLLQINTLTDVLYNVGFGGTILMIEERSCYMPRNAILFVNNEGKNFAYIEVCFECEQYSVNSDKIKFGDICNQKFQMLKTQFKNAGIEFGITK